VRSMRETASTLAVCARDTFLVHDAVPDISLCAQDLLLTGVLFLCALVCYVTYMVQHVYSASCSNAPRDRNHPDSLREGLLTRVKSPSSLVDSPSRSTATSMGPSSGLLPAIDMNQSSPNPASSLRWQPALLVCSSLLLGVLFASLAVLGGLSYAHGKTKTQVRDRVRESLGSIHTDGEGGVLDRDVHALRACLCSIFGNLLDSVICYRHHLPPSASPSLPLSLSLFCRIFTLLSVMQ